MDVHRSTCPHDCPSCCSLDIEVEHGRIGRVRGAKDNTYTAGVICEKVARYKERVEHPDRLKEPLLRRGDEWLPIGWEDALDLAADHFLRAEEKHGSQTVWPYYYAGTMGLVQRDSIQRLRHAKRYSGQYDTICITPAWTGFAAATGAIRGPDPREMAVSDCVVIWGTNAVSTQVNVMTHAMRARRERGAKIVVVDVYDNDTMRKADLALRVRPGTDAALACAVMHGLFRDGRADRAYLARHTKDAGRLEEHLRTRTPEWAAAVTGLSVDEIEAFVAILGERPRSYFRLGYGFTRTRNGAVAMHAAACVPTVIGAWQYEGGGAFHNNADIYGLDGALVKGTPDPDVRMLDQSQIGRVLTGDETALQGGPPVTAMLVQSTNPMSVAPEQRLVRQGFARSDLFTVVHEQFMTETARMADLVLPATMFVEHDDLYKGGGHSHIMHGPKLVEPPEGCRENLFVIEELAKRLGADDAVTGLTSRQLADDMLARSERPLLHEWEAQGFLDVQPSFEIAHYTNGFAHNDGKFHFSPNWQDVPWSPPPMGLLGPYEDAPDLPDQWDVAGRADDEHPYRLATSPARTFLNSTFNETPGSHRREGRPEAMIHPQDLEALGFHDGEIVALANRQGSVRLHAKAYDGVRRGVVVVESLHPNDAFLDGEGINTLTSAETVAPHGGAAFHDTNVRIARG